MEHQEHHKENIEKHMENLRNTKKNHIETNGNLGTKRRNTMEKKHGKAQKNQKTHGETKDKT